MEYMIAGLVVLTAVILCGGIKLSREKRRSAELESYLSETEKILKEFRTVRHQYNNMLQSVIFFIENEQWDQFKEFKEEILQSTSAINSRDELQLLKIRVHKLRSLISDMAGICAGLGVHLEVMVSRDIDRIGIDELALCRALRFLFDHILEEVKTSEKKEILLQISLDQEGAAIVLNSTFLSRPETGWLNRKNCSHGASVRKSGAAALKKLLKRHKNVIFNEYIEDEYYVQELMVMENI
jgi:two-component system sensor histidine kinase AgrC